MHRTDQANSARGFTLMELMTTIVIIVILVSILSVAVSTARTTAKKVATQSLLGAMSKATVLFRSDIGYLPPVLAADRSLPTADNEFPPVFPPNQLGGGNQSPFPNFREDLQQWYSVTSPAEFLLGWSSHNTDGYGRKGGNWTDESPRLGIRHPGLDGAWGATDSYMDGSPNTGVGDGDGSVRGRSAFASKLSGRSYGPYLEIDNKKMLGRMPLDANGEAKVDPVTMQPLILFPGDAGYADLLPYDEDGDGGLNDPFPTVIVDSWGSPIRYYRPLYPWLISSDSAGNSPAQTGLARRYPSSVDPFRPTLSDFFVLRPGEFDENEVANAVLDDFSNGVGLGGDRSTTLALRSGDFAYFSAGPDRMLNPYMRADEAAFEGQGMNGYDTDQYNKDNIVEIGP